MILERAVAAYQQSKITGLYAYKDDLAWAQAGEPYPTLMITATGSQRKALGAGEADSRRWDEETREWVFEKTWIYPYAIRFTVRGKAAGAQSGAAIVASTMDAIEAELRKYAPGKRLVLTDGVSGNEVIIRRLSFTGRSDQTSDLRRVPFEAQQTLDYELQHLQVVEVSRAPAFEDINIEVE